MPTLALVELLAPLVILTHGLNGLFGERFCHLSARVHHQMFLATAQKSTKRMHGDIVL